MLVDVGRGVDGLRDGLADGDADGEVDGDVDGDAGAEVDVDVGEPGFRVLIGPVSVGLIFVGKILVCVGSTVWICVGCCVRIPDGSALGGGPAGAAWPVVDITTTAVNATANTPAPTTNTRARMIACFVQWTFGRGLNSKGRPTETAPAR